MDLINAKRVALHRGVWFKWLSRIERAQVDLTIRIVETVRSPLLKNVLKSILKKLSEVAESQISRLKNRIGVPLARKLSLIATSWGYRPAEDWPQDDGFIQFLTISHMHTPEMFRT
jgi:lambda repressor-like predicted transcriptional regulator